VSGLAGSTVHAPGDTIAVVSPTSLPLVSVPGTPFASRDVAQGAPGLSEGGSQARDALLDVSQGVVAAIVRSLQTQVMSSLDLVSELLRVRDSISMSLSPNQVG
jgi:hypothetical protein